MYKVHTVCIMNQHKTIYPISSLHQEIRRQHLNTSVYLQKHLVHDAEEEILQKLRKKRLKTRTRSHTQLTLLHTEHAALVLIQYSTIPIIVEKAEWKRMS